MKTNAYTINKNIAFTSIARGFSLVFTFLYSILMVRLLGAEGNGVFTFLVVNAHIAILFLGFNVNNGLTYYLAKGNFPKEQVIGFVVFVFGVASLLLILLSSSLYLTDSPALRFILPIGYQGLFFLIFFLFTIFAYAIIMFSTAIALGNLFYKIYNQYVFFSSLAKVVLISLLFLGIQLNLIENKLEYAFVIFLFIEFIFAVFFFLFLRKRQAIHVSFHFPYQTFIKPFFIYSIKGWSIILLKFFSSRFFNWVITFYHGLKSLGFMALAVSLYTNAEMFFTPIHQALSPYLVKLPIEEGKERFLFFLRLTNSAAILMAIGAFFLSPILVPLIFGKEFENSVVVTQILFLSMPFLSLGGMSSTYAAAQNKHHFIVAVEAITFIMIIIADLIFIPPYGILGAAWVMLVAFSFSGCLTSFFMIRQLYVPVHRNLVIKRKDLSYIQQFLKSKIRHFLS